MCNLNDLTVDFIQTGTVKCIGNGELIANLYINGVMIGELHGTNGTQEGEEAYMPTIKEWYESLDDEYKDYIAKVTPTEVICPVCGDIIYTTDAMYEDENPNSSDMYYGQLIEQHRHEHDVENNEEFMSDALPSPFTNEEAFTFFDMLVISFKKDGNKVYLLNDFSDIKSISVEEWQSAVNTLS